MSDLAVDLVGEILSRVPLTSLSAVRCTCKSWNALSKHQVIGKAEVAATKQFLGFMVMGSRVCSLRFDLQGIRNDGDDFVDPSIEGLQKSGLKIRNKAFKKNYEKSMILTLIHGGLLNLIPHAERFGPHISLPFHSYDDEAGAVTLSCVRQEQLALLYHNRETVESLEIWITNQIDPNAVSWSMFFKVDIKPLIGFPKVFEPASFFIDEEKKVAVVSEGEYSFRTNETCRYQTLYIIGEDGYFKSFKIRCSDSPELSSYAPSLVLVETKQQGK
ncbi:F-box domain, partial [Arabidopsis suecica]